ncbi:MAG: 16S rRNA (cytidine(1402)-2'-O)-methyltransferase [Candidatus Levyibacteriota bacterium]
MNFFIVATPIGNLQDITLRAIDILKNVDVVVCEDTRVTGNLLHHLGIQKRMVALNDANEESKSYGILELLSTGQSIALVSDAGTPLISDPGFKLVREAIKKGYTVTPIPGANAITTALCASGLPTDKFLFMGFPPDSLEKKKKWFSNISNLYQMDSNDKIRPTIIFFESPHKIVRALEAMEEVFGDIEVVLARELTKIHEEFLRNKVSELQEHFSRVEPRGEFVVSFHL